MGGTQAGNEEMMPSDPPPIPTSEAVAPGGASLPVWADFVAVGLALLAPVVLVILWRGDVIRPGSFGRRGRRDVSAWPWWFWLLCSFAVVFAASIGAGMAMPILDVLVEDPPRTTEMAFMTAAGSLAGLAAAFLLMVVAAREHVEVSSRAGLGLRPRVGDAKLGVLGIVLAIPVVSAVSLMSMQLYRLVMERDPGVLAHETLEVLHAGPRGPAVWVLIASAVLAAPIIEEIAFRVFLQSALIRMLGRVWPAILGAGAVFALVHLLGGVGPEHWHALPALFALGIAMGVAYEWTRRPAVPIVMHMIFNAYNVALVIFGAV